MNCGSRDRDSWIAFDRGTENLSMEEGQRTNLEAATHPSSALPPSHIPANAAIDLAARRYMSRSQSGTPGAHRSSSATTTLWTPPHKLHSTYVYIYVVRLLILGRTHGEVLYQYMDKVSSIILTILVPQTFLVIQQMSTHTPHYQGVLKIVRLVSLWRLLISFFIVWDTSKRKDEWFLRWPCIYKSESKIYKSSKTIRAPLFKEMVWTTVANYEIRLVSANICGRINSVKRCIYIYSVPHYLYCKIYKFNLRHLAVARPFAHPEAFLRDRAVAAPEISKTFR